MIEPGAVAALALDVVIRGVLHQEVTGRVGGQIAVVAHRMTAFARRARPPGSLQARPGLRVRGSLPLGLVLDVTVAAIGLLLADGEVTEEAVGCVLAGHERPRDVLDRLFRARADRQHREDHRTEDCRAVDCRAGELHRRTPVAWADTQTKYPLARMKGSFPFVNLSS